MSSTYKLEYYGKLSDISNRIMKKVDDPAPEWEELDLLVRNINNEPKEGKRKKLLEELAATAIRLAIIHT